MQKLMVIALAFFMSPTLAFSWPAAVQRVLDGDTVAVYPLGDTSTALHIRLYGIDSPEKNQPFGEEATAFLMGLLPAGKQVEIISLDTDRYGRIVALLYAGKVNINAEQIKVGNARIYGRYCKAAFCKQWRSLQDKAAETKKGMWAK